MLLSIVNYLRGYAVIRIHGSFPERFLNISAANGIEFWKLEREKDGSFKARIRPRSIGMLESLAGHSLCTAEVIGKKGTRYKLSGLKKRYFFLLGLFFCALLIWTLSIRVWSFQVIGNQTVSEDEILSQLASFGIRPGIRASQIDPSVIRDEMLVAIPKLRWLTVNLNGSRAAVEVRERVIPPALPDEKTPQNIVASSSGVIDELLTLEGSAQVKNGETVTQGQLLVSGVMDTVIGARLVHAEAVVYAKTWHSFKAFYPATGEQKLDSLEKNVSYSLIVGSFRINIFKSAGNYTCECDKIIERNVLTVFGDIKLPVYLEKTISTGYTTKPVSLKCDDKLLSAATKQQLESSGLMSLSTTQELTADSKGFVSSLTAECREDIALPSKIVINNFTEQ